uniref:Uncharacterized protein n=1 Tax=Amphimedon queenslandica TaxID=400682 RepID=A0A1X7VFC7_AMPQE
MAPVPVSGMPPSSDPAMSGVSSHHSPVVLPSQAFGMPGPPSDPDISLSLSAEPIPARLVQMIQSGQFVEMKELLGDYIGLTQHFESSACYFPMVLPSSARPRLQEVSTLCLWIYCFLTYLAVLVPDQFIQDRLVYARSLVQESLCHGGRGWLDYERLFLQQVALDHSLSWGTLHPSLVASTILSQHAGSGTFCQVCQGCDHSSA